MKNKILVFLLIFLLSILNTAKAQDSFTFDVTEAEILDNGNTFIGSKRGIAISNQGVSISADNFKYDKLSNILYANGNTIINDTINKVKIFSDDLTYLKNEEIIFTKGRSKAINENVTLDADEFEYKKNENKLIASGNVNIVNKIENYIINTQKITHEVNKKKYLTEGPTEAIIDSEYNINSKDVIFLEKEMRFISYNRSKIKDGNNNLYELDEFDYFANKKILKGKNILLITNYLKPNADKTFFSNGIFNFNSKQFVSKDTKVFLHNSLFDGEIGRAHV